MVLVDTSVWIRFLANRAPYAAELDGLLGIDEVTGHELVYGELLIGDRGGRGKLLAAYERMHQAATVPHSDVVEFVRDRATKQPAKEETLQILEEARNMGVLLGKGGIDGNVIRVKPPMCITTEDADYALEVIHRALQSVESE